MANYCSVSCQKYYFIFHKNNCKSISEQQQAVDKLLENERGVRSWSHATVFTIDNLADLLIKVGYRESNTIKHGSLYYLEALKYYLAPRTLIKDYYYTMFPCIEDQFLLMLINLGGIIENSCNGVWNRAVPGKTTTYRQDNSIGWI